MNELVILGQLGPFTLTTYALCLLAGAAAAVALTAYLGRRNPGVNACLSMGMAAIVGAVIAEWLGGFSGLGVYMIRVRKSFSYDRMFAAIILISALSLGLMALVDLLERICTPWRRAEGNRK